APDGCHAAGDGDLARRFPSTVSTEAPWRRGAPRRGRRRPLGGAPGAWGRSPLVPAQRRRAIPLAAVGAIVRPGRAAEVTPSRPPRNAGDRRPGRHAAAPAAAI